jgi:hypothetical protein
MPCCICGAPGDTAHYAGEKGKRFGLCTKDPRCYWLKIMRDARAKDAELRARAQQ